MTSRNLELTGKPTRLHESLEPTQDPRWVLNHEGYNVLSESAVEFGFALGNGFLGTRAARSVSRGPTWVARLGYSRWASGRAATSPACLTCPTSSRRCRGACRRLVPRAHRARRRTAAGSRGRSARQHPQARRHHGLRLSAWEHRTPAGITVEGRELRLLSLADRGRACNSCAAHWTVTASTSGWRRVLQWQASAWSQCVWTQDLGAWRSEGTGKGVAMTGAATLRLRRRSARPRPSVLAALGSALAFRGRAGSQTDRLVAVARADTPEDDPAPRASAALARSRALGRRAVLAAHEAAWDARWTASDVLIEGDDELQRAVRFAVYHRRAPPTRRTTASP